MFDLDRAAFEFPCPKCDFVNSATVREARLAMRIICRGCKRDICLIDNNAGLETGRRRVSEAMKSLENELILEIKL